MVYSVEMIERFLGEVDSSFPIPLSQKQNLKNLAEKFYEKATVCAEIENKKICSAVIGYTENIENNRAYISVVATVSGAQGRGLASKLVKEFLSRCEEKEITSVHLYTAASNVSAIRMYQKLGFKNLVLEDEPRPEDVHLIYYI